MKSLATLKDEPSELAGFIAELDELERQRRLDRDARIKRDTAPGSLLTSWAAIRVYRYRDKQTKELTDPHIPALAKLAIKEPWCFDGENDQYSILRDYLRTTFYRLACEEKIAFIQDHACFNTGLVDDAYRPIYAVFNRNHKEGSRPYRIRGFCVTGEEDLGKWFMRKFPRNLRPPAASYISKLKHVIVKPDVEIILQESHVIDDGIIEGRYPLDFLLSNLPPGVQAPASRKPTNAWFEKYVEALSTHRKSKVLFASRLNGAKDIALQRVGWNYKTVIPNYFPTRDEMSILLPLALLDDTKPDIALVISPVNDGEFDWYVVTVYSLDMAYSSARVISKPLSDWLLVEKIAPSAPEEGEIHDGEEEGDEQ